MLTNSIDIQKQEEMPSYEVLPEDIYVCEITDVNEVEQPSYDDPSIKEKALKFEFTITEGEFQDRKCWKKVTPKLNAGFEGGQPSNLHILMSAVLGKPPVIEEIDYEKINDLIGKSLRIALKIKESKEGKEYNIINDFYAMKK